MRQVDRPYRRPMLITAAATVLCPALWSGIHLASAANAGCGVTYAISCPTGQVC